MNAWQRVQVWHPARKIKVLNALFLVGFPGQKHCTHVTAYVAAEGRCTLCVSPQGGRKHWKPMHEFLQIPLMSFPLTELAMYPSAFINLSCESNNILNARVLLLNLGICR